MRYREDEDDRILRSIPSPRVQRLEVPTTYRIEK